MQRPGRGGSEATVVGHAISGVGLDSPGGLVRVVLRPAAPDAEDLEERVVRRSTTRSLSGMIALSVMWMCSGQTSVQHLVMLQRPSPASSAIRSSRSSPSSGCISSEREPDHESRTVEAVLQIVVAQDVADVLAEEALDALAELAHPVDVLLRDQEVARRGGPHVA